MRNKDDLNKYNLKYKVMKDIYTFFSQSSRFKNINFKNLGNISSFEKSKCLLISKNLCNYIKSNGISQWSDDTIVKSLYKNIKNINLKIHKKNIELIKFYTNLFLDKNCSHLSFYLFNNSSISLMNQNENSMCIVLYKTPKYSVILNEHLDVFTKKRVKKCCGEIFMKRKWNTFSANIKHKFYLCVCGIITSYFLIFNTPNNYIIMEMNLTMHMKMNNRGYILSYRPQSKLARNMIKQTQPISRKFNSSVTSLINYGIENKILKPGNEVKIYIIGPPLKNKLFENLKLSLKDIPLDIIINNSGNLIKINRT